MIRLALILWPSDHPSVVNNCFSLKVISCCCLSLNKYFNWLFIFISSAVQNSGRISLVVFLVKLCQLASDESLINYNLCLVFAEVDLLQLLDMKGDASCLSNRKWQINAQHIKLDIMMHCPCKQLQCLSLCPSGSMGKNPLVKPVHLTISLICCK